MTVSMAGIRVQRSRGDVVDVDADEFERMYVKGFCEPADDDATALAVSIDRRLEADEKKARREAEKARERDAAALKKQQVAGERQATNKEAEGRETAATTGKRAG